ncbi:helix-turn-helix domain-containing protein [Dyella terrae]|uniref:helix-turn-helix domain-containing protein n=1 Tax=Dyella terrae TaxID=522259 RepID=UPI001EFED481|nr:helix-turn-helix transcriptional regulator [Dyella terrae]ULU23798.1 Helix-turn-helix protein [Dyella terrae]
MNSSNQLLGIYRQRLSLKTNQAIADKLGVKQPTVSMWLNEKSHPNAEAIADMCKATGESLAKWLPLIESERCRTDADKKVWLRLAQMAAAITLTVGVFGPHSTARAEAGNFAKSADSVYYVKSRMDLLCAPSVWAVTVREIAPTIDTTSPALGPDGVYVANGSLIRRAGAGHPASFFGCREMNLASPSVRKMIHRLNWLYPYVRMPIKNAIAALNLLNQCRMRTVPQRRSTRHGDGHR